MGSGVGQMDGWMDGYIDGHVVWNSVMLLLMTVPYTVTVSSASYASISAQVGVCDSGTVRCLAIKQPTALSRITN